MVAYMHYGGGTYEYHKTNERDFYDYMFHCSVAAGSGEFAFTKLTYLQDHELFVYSIRDELKYLSVPIFIVCGAQDFLLHQSNLLYHCIPLRTEDKEFIVLPNSGHNCMLQSSSLFNKLVVERLYRIFLQEG